MWLIKTCLSLQRTYKHLVNSCPWTRIELIWIVTLSTLSTIIYKLPTYIPSLVNIVFLISYISVGFVSTALVIAACITPVVVYLNRCAYFFDTTNEERIKRLEDDMRMFIDMNDVEGIRFKIMMINQEIQNVKNECERRTPRRSSASPQSQDP